MLVCSAAEGNSLRREVHTDGFGAEGPSHEGNCAASAATHIEDAATLEFGVADQLEGRYKVKNAAMKGLHAEAKAMLAKGATLESIAARVAKEKIDPKPKSGRQEYYENLLNRYL